MLTTLPITRADITDQLAELTSKFDFDIKQVRKEAYASVPKFRMRADRPILFTFMDYPPDPFESMQRLEDEMVLAHRFAAEDELGLSQSAYEIPEDTSSASTKKSSSAEYNTARQEWKDAVIKSREFKAQCDAHVAMLKKRMQDLR